MTRLTDYTSYADAQAHADPAALWDLFDGDRDRFNIAHECITRHADGSGSAAVRIAHADGSDEVLSFDTIAAGAARFAHWLVAQGIARGDRVAFVLEPTLPYYVCLFGAMQAGAIAVPMFTLFGPDALRLRIDDCRPAILLTDAGKADMVRGVVDDLGAQTSVIVADGGLLDAIAGFPATFTPVTTASDVAVFQYTSGTTRALPEAVKHRHRSLVTLMFAVLYGTGIRPGDQVFCPSSPAWGHGLWQGTLAPLALGATTGTLAGKFDPVRLMRALDEYGITNLTAAPTHFRMMKNTGAADRFRFHCSKLSYTGEPIDPATLEFIDRHFGVPACSLYGTTEIGVVLVNYPGAEDFQVKPGSLGKPVPGLKLEVHRPDGSVCAPGEVGELMLWRRGRWESTKDRARTDEDGYFYHCGRADDVIISAGWTLSAIEIENTLLKHEGVLECAVIGVPDDARGQVVKAFVRADRPGDEGFARALQDFTRARLGQHEFPRLVEFVSELPKTPAGKVNRHALRAGSGTGRAALTIRGPDHGPQDRGDG